MPKRRRLESTRRPSASMLTSYPPARSRGSVIARSTSAQRRRRSCGENNAVSYYLPGPEWGTILLFATDGAKPLDAIVGGNQCTALDVSDHGRLLAFSDFLDNRPRTYEVPSILSLRQAKAVASRTMRKT